MTLAGQHPKKLTYALNLSVCTLYFQRGFVMEFLFYFYFYFCSNSYSLEELSLCRESFNLQLNLQIHFQIPASPSSDVSK